jgi:hypothetical protein
VQAAQAAQAQAAQAAPAEVVAREGMVVQLAGAGGAVLVARAPAPAGAVIEVEAAAPAPEAAETVVPTDPAIEALPDEGIDVEMSPPVAADDPSLEEAKTWLRDALVRAGLTAGEADLFLSLYAKPFFESEEMVVLFRLPVDVIEQKLPLVVYPSPTQTVRVPLVLVRNIDPKIKDEVAQMVAQLGAIEYAVREAAEKRLVELGRLAVPAVRTALSSPDLEVVFRAERILIRQNESIEVQ